MLHVFFEFFEHLFKWFDTSSDYFTLTYFQLLCGSFHDDVVVSPDAICSFCVIHVVVLSDNFSIKSIMCWRYGKPYPVYNFTTYFTMLFGSLYNKKSPPNEGLTRPLVHSDCFVATPHMWICFHILRQKVYGKLRIKRLFFFDVWMCWQMNLNQSKRLFSIPNLIPVWYVRDRVSVL
jgi:hypothetical protein